MHKKLLSTSVYFLWTWAAVVLAASGLSAGGAVRAVPIGQGARRPAAIGMAARADRLLGRQVDLQCPAQFITALALDRQGNLWVGTEDHGVYRYDPRLPVRRRWTQFGAASGVGDNNVYAIVCDRRGRIWVGTLTHGVAVYNGQHWRRYNVIPHPRRKVLAGPIGSRIFAMAANPVNGDVWMATDAGISRYRGRTDRWQYITRAGGLPGAQAMALALGPHGRLYVALQVGGIAISTPARHYRNWRVVTGPRDMPGRATGTGLPCRMINALLVLPDGHVYAATDNGLANSADHGRTWRFVHGRDFSLEIGGMAKPPRNFRRPSAAEEARMPPDDYVTCLAAMPGSAVQNLWLGCRRNGFADLHVNTGLMTPETLWKTPPATRPAGPGAAGPKRAAPAIGAPAELDVGTNFISALLALPDGSVIVGRYGGMLTRYEPRGYAKSLGDVLATGSNGNARSVGERFPAPAATWTPAEFARALTHLTRLRQSLPRKRTPAFFLGDDWTTKGDWIEHYGLTYTDLFGTNGQFHDVRDFQVQVYTGPHVGARGAVYGYTMWLHTNKPNCLFDPQTGTRRYSEVNDGGWRLPWYWQGPNLWIAVKFPKGNYVADWYLYNKDGHSGGNRRRDFVMNVRPPAANRQVAMREKPLDTTRIVHFWGGVYKRFLVRGPGRYWFHIRRNHGECVTVSGLMIDRWKRNSAAGKIKAPAALRPAVALWRACRRRAPPDAAWADQAHVCQVECLRAAVAAAAPWQARWRSVLNIWWRRDRENLRKLIQKKLSQAVRADPQLYSFILSPAQRHKWWPNNRVRSGSQAR